MHGVEEGEEGGAHRDLRLDQLLLRQVDGRERREVRAQRPAHAERRDAAQQRLGPDDVDGVDVGLGRRELARRQHDRHACLELQLLDLEREQRLALALLLLWGQHAAARHRRRRRRGRAARRRPTARRQAGQLHGRGCGRRRRREAGQTRLAAAVAGCWLWLRVRPERHRLERRVVERSRLRLAQLVARSRQLCSARLRDDHLAVCGARALQRGAVARPVARPGPRVGRRGRHLRQARPRGRATGRGAGRQGPRRDQHRLYILDLLAVGLELLPGAVH